LFEEATRYLGSSNYSTHNIMKPLIAKIINKLKHKENDVFVLDDIIDSNNSEKECQRSINLDEILQTLGVLEN
ncbi:1597_t:CDS:2, partial [Funneliformis geosporum]